MNSNDYLSEFQFKGSIIRKLNIDNNLVSLPEIGNLDIKLEIKNDISYIENNDDEGILYAGVLLMLNIIVKSKNSDKSMKIDFCIEGRFHYNGNDKGTFEQMLLLNGTSTLYSIARANIATVTSISLQSGKINLPMVNFVKFFQAQREQELKNKSQGLNR